MRDVAFDLAQMTTPQIGFLLTWGGMVVVLIVGMVALARANRMDPARRLAGSRRFLAWLLSSDPRQQVLMMRYLVGLLNGMVGVLALNYGVYRGEVDAQSCRELTMGALITGIGWFLVLRTGLNRRLPDPSMTEPQMMSAIVLLGWGYAIGGPGSPVALMLLFVILMFGMFRVTVRQLVRCCILSVVVFAVALWHVAVQPSTSLIEAEILAVYFGVLVIMLVSMCLLMMHLQGIRQRSWRRKQKLGEALDKLRELSIRDELTGLFNRRHMLDLLGVERARAERSGRPWSVALIDVDHFKAVNDNHGHGVGDEVLHAVAQVISEGLRDADQVARWGGEEFLVMFPDTDCEHAVGVLERIRQTLDGALVSRAVPDLKVTFSAGVSCVEADETLDHTIDRADQALYLAKARGRNRTEHHRVAARRAG